MPTAVLQEHSPGTCPALARTRYRMLVRRTHRDTQRLVPGIRSYISTFCPHHKLPKAGSEKLDMHRPVTRFQHAPAKQFIFSSPSTHSHPFCAVGSLLVSFIHSAVFSLGGVAAQIRIRRHTVIWIEGCKAGKELRLRDHCFTKKEKGESKRGCELEHC